MRNKFLWRNVYQLRDEETVRNSSIKDFGDRIENCLLLLKYPEKDDASRQESLETARSEYRQAQDAYDRREPLFSRFELDSEYFPIVIIRSLLPMLGHYLEMGDCETALKISGWVCDNIDCYRDMMENFGQRIGKSQREFQQPA